MAVTLNFSTLPESFGGTADDKLAGIHATHAGIKE
jgi:hypothetical protein